MTSRGEQRANLVRFGVFELDLAAGELRRNGVRIKLQEQPFQVLAVLLERPGVIVTREELVERLWPDGTFVEFDRSLNIAINKLRDALDDSANNPRFVETVPRRGYRFIAPVEGARRAGRRRGMWAAFAVVALVSAAVAAWFAKPEQTRQPSPAVPLTSYPGQELHPSLSPDGNQVAFVWNGPNQDNFDVYVKLIGPGEPIRLTTDPRQDFSPVWSPDGKYIAFQRVLGPERAGVFLIPALGGPERQVAEGDERLPTVLPLHVSIAWSPDSRRLVMTDRLSPQQPRTLFLVDVDTGAKTPVTSPASESQGDNHPAFSPDGRTLVFTRGSDLAGRDLYVLKLADDFSPIGVPERLTNGMQVTGRPVWTPDGRAILFSSAAQAYGPQRLWKVPASGAEAPAPLDSAGSGVAFPTLSRQGNRLVYAHGRRIINIWSIGLSGPDNRPGPPRKLIASTLADSWPQFSPDGSRIAFQSGRSGVHEIWICDRDGSNPEQLTAFGLGLSGTPHWSPDGRQIAFDSTGDGQGHFDIYVMDVDGRNRRRLTHQAALNAIPSWSRDGNWIYFTSNRTGEGQIWKVPAGGGEPVQVTEGGGMTAFESPSGEFLYFTRRGALSYGLWVMRVVGGEETEVFSPVYNRNFAVVEDGIYFAPQPEPSGKSIIRYFD
ncbi:MAG: DUF5050 domain-containing protein, partial [bacterium]|nr:DUF5050 domain-containing protein [bacterium]